MCVCVYVCMHASNIYYPLHVKQQIAQGEKGLRARVWNDAIRGGGWFCVSVFKDVGCGGWVNSASWGNHCWLAPAQRCRPHWFP